MYVGSRQGRRWEGYCRGQSIRCSHLQQEGCNGAGWCGSGSSSGSGVVGGAWGAVHARNNAGRRHNHVAWVSTGTRVMRGSGEGRSCVVWGGGRLRPRTPQRHKPRGSNHLKGEPHEPPANPENVSNAQPTSVIRTGSVGTGASAVGGAGRQRV